MKKYVLILFILASVSIQAETKSLADACKKLGGEIVNSLLCPKSKKNRDGEFCVISNRPLVYFNGCTKSVGDYGDTFFKACLKHDFCYHHEPATNGLSKKNCDNNFYSDMLSVCMKNDKLSDFISCRSIAWGFYQAVKVGGKKSWECSNSVFDYSNIDIILGDFSIKKPLND